VTGLKDVRKTVVMIESVHHDGGPRVDQPLLRGAIAAVVNNPYAGRFEPNLLPWMESLQPLAEDLARQLLAALRVGPEAIKAFGKGAIVGVDGEMEHAAIWHSPGGQGMKKVLNARGFVTAGQIMGTIGAQLHIPLVYVNSPWVRSHFDAVDLTIADAPRPREIVFALAMSTGARVHARLGGLTPQRVEMGEGPKF
jgi:hypothetical protein